jgi:hypothetical protein
VEEKCRKQNNKKNKISDWCKQSDITISLAFRQQLTVRPSCFDFPCHMPYHAFRPLVYMAVVLWCLRKRPRFVK